MNLLLDTHVFLWFITDDPRLPSAFASEIRRATNNTYLSTASVWEVVIKHASGKMPLPSPPDRFIPAQREAHCIEALEINEAAMPFLASLPPRHRDPFDRLLIAQANQHNLTLLTVDTQVEAYDVKTLPR